MTVLTKLVKIAFMILLLEIMLLTLTQPVISTYLVEGESGIIPVRVFNFFEFSGFGGITLISPIVLAALYFIRFSNESKMLYTAEFFIINTICTVIAFRASYLWLMDLGEVRFHPTIIAYPLAFAVASGYVYLSAKKALADEE